MARGFEIATHQEEDPQSPETISTGAPHIATGAGPGPGNRERGAPTGRTSTTATATAPREESSPLHDSQATATGTCWSRLRSVMPSTRGHSSLEETRELSRELFTSFYREKFNEEGLEPPPREEEELHEAALEEGAVGGVFHSSHNSTASAFDGYSNPCMVAVGRELRGIAERFEKSRERQDIRNRANEVNMNIVSYDHFQSLLLELFNNGQVTRERIVVLFFFCTDLALRAFTATPGRSCCQFLTWSLQFIYEKICSWVYGQGGWEVVLCSYVPRLVGTVLASLACVALTIYIAKNLRPPSSS